jgi:hypothetical protein
MRNATRRTLALIVVAVGTLAMQGTAQAAEPSQEEAVSTALARAQKFGTVEDVSVASMTAEQAAAAAGLAPGEPGSIAIVEPGTPVNNVTVKGQFIDYLAHTPRKSATPTGTEMTFTINKATGFVSMIHLDGQMDGQNVTVATAARVRAKIARTARPRAHIASWGKSKTTGKACSQGNHCYAVAGWYMPATGGAVEGSIDEVNPTTMDVPGWDSGDFVDQEGWTSFPSTGYWVESGATAGEYMSCCSIHPFWARENGAGYVQGVAEWTLSGEHAYQEWAIGSGTWNIYWDGKLIEGNLGGFSTYSEDVEAGTEIAANTKPSAAAEIDTAVWWTEETEHNWSYENEKYADEGMCLGRDGRHPALGNITTGTC